MAKSMRIQIEVDVHAVTCPGVWFACKSPVYLSICFLGFHVRTKPFPANFPLLFADKFIFEKTFPGKRGNSRLQIGSLTFDRSHPVVGRLSFYLDIFLCRCVDPAAVDSYLGAPAPLCGASARGVAWSRAHGPSGLGHFRDFGQ